MTIKSNVITEYTAGTGVTIDGVLIKDSKVSDIALSAKHAVYCLGDSLTAAGTYPNKLQALLGTSWIVHNAGIGGYETSQMVTRVTQICVDPGDGEYLVVLGGINDIIHGITEAAIKINLQAIYTAASNAGFTVVAVTITPFKTNTNWSAGFQTILDNVNTWIGATAINVDYVIDAYTLLEDPAAADTLLGGAGTYDSGDHLHLSTLGYETMAQEIYDEVTWTPATTAAGISIGGTATITINQDLTTTSSPSFLDVYCDDLTAEATVAAYDVVTGHIMPAADGIAAIAIQKADSLTNVVTIDTTNSRVYIGTYYGAPLTYTLQVNGSLQAGELRVVRTDGAPFFVIENFAATNNTNAYISFKAYGSDKWAVGMGVTAVADQFTIYSSTLARAVFVAKGTGEIGFHGVTPVARATLATGAGATVDNVISALQNLGLVKQS